MKREIFSKTAVVKPMTRLGFCAGQNNPVITLQGQLLRMELLYTDEIMIFRRRHVIIKRKK